MITPVRRVRYTLFVVIFWFTVPQNHYSFPVKPMEVRDYGTHQNKNIGTTFRSEAASTDLSRNLEYSRSTAGSDYLNATGLSRFLDPLHNVPDIFPNPAADLIVYPPSLARFEAFNRPNFLSTCVDRFLQRISIITGKLVNLLPFRAVPLRRLVKRELGGFISHPSSVANRSSSNWKSVSTEKFVPKSGTRSRTLKVLKQNQRDPGSNQTKKFGYSETVSWPSIATFTGSVRVDPTQRHAVAPSKKKTPKTPNSRPKGHKGKYREDFARNLKSYKNCGHLNRPSHNFLDRKKHAETARFWSRDGDGSQTKAHGNLVDSQRSRFTEEQIQNELNQSDQLVSRELPQKEFETFSDWHRAADPNVIGLPMNVQSASSVSSKSDRVLLPHTIDGQVHKTDSFTELSHVVYQIVIAKRAKAMVAAPCHSTAAWFPSVLKRLENEVSDLQFYCVDTSGSETEHENLKKAFNGISSLKLGGFLLTNPDDIESVMPKNMDMAITWFEIQQWGVRRALRFLAGLRRSGVHTILVTYVCSSVAEEEEGNETSTESGVATFRISATKEKADECSRIVVYSPGG